MSNHWISMGEVSKAAEIMTPEEKNRQRWGVTGLLNYVEEDRRTDLAVLLENQQRWNKANPKMDETFAISTIPLIRQMFERAEKNGMIITSRFNPPKIATWAVFPPPDIEYPWDRNITTLFQEAITKPYKSSQWDTSNFDKVADFLAQELKRINGDVHLCLFGMAWDSGYVYLMYERA